MKTKVRRCFFLEAFDPVTDEEIVTPETLVPYLTERQMRRAAERIEREYRAEIEVVTGMFEYPGLGIAGFRCNVPLSQY